jgi:hypothetical protein
MSDRRAKAVTAAGTNGRSIDSQSVLNVLGAASHDIDLGAASHDIDLGAASHDIDTARTNYDQRPSTFDPPFASPVSFLAKHTLGAGRGARGSTTCSAVQPKS